MDFCESMDAHHFDRVSLHNEAETIQVLPREM